MNGEIKPKRPSDQQQQQREAVGCPRPTEEFRQQRQQQTEIFREIFVPTLRQAAAEGKREMGTARRSQNPACIGSAHKQIKR